MAVEAWKKRRKWGGSGLDTTLIDRTDPFKLCLRVITIRNLKSGTMKTAMCFQPICILSYYSSAPVILFEKRVHLNILNCRK